jgi:hypothetical protein
LTPLWRELIAHRSDLAAALLITVLTAGWFMASRTGPEALRPPFATRSMQSALIADISARPTAMPSLNPEATRATATAPGPSLAPVFTSGPTPGSSTATGVPPPSGPTPGPTKSAPPAPPAPTDGADPTPTPGQKSPATPSPTPQALPDLTSTDYGFGSAQPACGVVNVGYVVVRNAGKAAAPAGVVVLFKLVEGETVTWTSEQTIQTAITPGGTAELKAEFTLSLGCDTDVARTWSVIIDPKNAVAESDEKNNTVAITFTIAKG